MTKYLDYSGLKRFKNYLKKEFESKLSVNDEIDSSVIGNETASDNIVTVKTLSYYHKKLLNGDQMKSTIEEVVADALVLRDDEIKSEIYENVENIIDEKMQWKNDFPS